MITKYETWSLRQHTTLAIVSGTGREIESAKAYLSKRTAFDNKTNANNAATFRIIERIIQT